MNGTTRLLLSLAGTALVLAAIYLGREILIPLALAAFLSFVLAAPVRWLERIRFGRIPAVLTVVAITTAVIAGLSWLVVSEAGQVAQDFTRYRGNVVAKLQSLRHTVAGAFGQWNDAIKTLDESSDTEPATAQKSSNGGRPAATTETDEEQPQTQPVRVEVVPARENAFKTVVGFLGPVVHPLTTAGVTAVLVIFFLIYREDLRDRILCLCGRARLSVTTAALTESARRVTRYVGAQTLSNGLIGLAIGLGLYAMAMPNPALWGLLAAVFRFVPFVGATIAGFFPVAQAVAISDGWTLPLIIVAWIVLVDLASANFLEPWLFGSRTGASPTAIVVAFVVWTWLWGAIGMLLAMPITVCMIVLGKHIPALEFLYVLLSDEPVLDPAERLYQRLLSGDRWEAERMVQAMERPPEYKIDNVIMPALALLERDRQAGLLQAKTIEHARETITSLVQSLPAEEIEASGGQFSEVVVLDRGAFDSLIPLLLARVAGTTIEPSRILSGDSLTAEVVQQVRTVRPSAVLLTGIEAGDMGRMRHLHRRLADAGVTNVLIALYGHNPAPHRVNWTSSVLINAPLREVLARLRTLSLGRPVERTASAHRLTTPSDARRASFATAPSGLTPPAPALD